MERWRSSWRTPYPDANEEKFKGSYVLEGPGAIQLQFLFFEEPSGRIRYEVYLDEDYLEEGHTDGDRNMDWIAKRCYEWLEKYKRLQRGYEALKKK